MIEKGSALLNRLINAWDYTAEETLWGALCIGMFLATVHLLSMLVTRWGDRKATAKALIFSLLVHTSCTMGLVATHPAVRHSFAPLPAEEPVEVKIEQSFVERTETFQREAHGDKPLWERLPDPVANELTRLDRAPHQADPFESPERQPEEEITTEPQVPDLPTRPEEQPVSPQVADAAPAGIRYEEEIPLDVDAPVAEARTEVSVPATAEGRAAAPRTATIDAGVERQSTEGTVDRAAPELDPSKQLAAIPMEDDPTAYIAREPVEEGSQLREGPSPAAVPLDEPGTPDGAAEQQTGSGERIASRLNPGATRTAPSTNEGTLERLRPKSEPKSDRPDVADGLSLRTPIDAPQPGLEPSVARPNLEVIPRSSASVPSTYRLRNLDRRQETARRFGGTGESERAVEMSLRWLASNQSSDGRWDADRFGAGKEFDANRTKGQYAGKDADAGVTALAILAFLGAGYTHEDGQYAVQVDKAVRWLVRNQREDGYLGANATHYEQNYCHAMATFALGEAYGMQADPQSNTFLVDPLTKAVQYILANQNPSDGGWRYVKGQSGDMSMFGWQLMALKSSEIAGVKVPQLAKDRMITFLNARSLGEQKGLAGYRVDMPPTPTMTAEALFCKQVLGLDRNNPASLEAVDYLMKSKPNRSDINMYYWYYGTLSMYQYGGESWRDWNETLRDLLIAEQVKSGANAGSWDPKCRWGGYGGRVYSTAMCTLCLEVYYRFLPLYQSGGKYEE